MKFSIKDLFIKWDQIRSFLQIWSHLLKKSLMENFIFLCNENGSYNSSSTLFIIDSYFLISDILSRA